MDPPLVTTRFIGIDLHKQSLTIAAVDAQQQVVVRPVRMTLAEFTAWAPRHHLAATDAVVLEATTNAWWLVDVVQVLVGRLTVAHPRHLQLITAARHPFFTKDAGWVAAGLRTMGDQIWTAERSWGMVDAI